MTEKFQQYLKANAGKKNLQEMSAELGMPLGTITCYASQLKISLKTWKPMNLLDYVRQNSGKKTVKEMAEEKQCCLSSIYTVASKLGISLLMADKENKLKQVILEQGENLTAKEIAAMVETSVMTVYGRARRLQVVLKSERTVTEQRMEEEVCNEPEEENALFSCGKYKNWLI